MRAFFIITITACLVMASPGPRAGGDNLPSLSDSASRGMSPEKEEALGREIMRQVRAEGWLLDDAELTEYIQDLGQRLLSHSSGANRKFNFFVVDNSSVNAFALPGGNIGMFAGMIMASKNESELAGVMAHEIAHVTQRHIARGMEQASRLDIATMIGMIAGLMIGMSAGDPNITEAAIMTGASLSIQGRINFTRAHEYEADRVGIGTLAAAGFDPLAMATMFEQMERRARLSGQNVPEFLSTHPVSSARVSEARNRAAAHGDVMPTESRTYLLMQARARALTTPPDEAMRFFTDNMPGASPVELSALNYGRALAQTRMHRTEEARKLLTPLLKADDDLMHYHLAVAETHVVEGDLDTAIERYEHVMRLFPRSLAVTTAYAQALIETGRGKDAFTHLVSLLPRPHPDPRLYRMLASSSDASGDLADAHYFMSEVYAMNGELRPAIQQLQIALAVPDITEQQRSRMEARMEQLVQHMPRNRQVSNEEQDSRRR